MMDNTKLIEIPNKFNGGDEPAQVIKNNLIQ